MNRAIAAFLCVALTWPALAAAAPGHAVDAVLGNQAPVITTTPSSPAMSDVLYTYDADATDPDGPSQTWSLQSASHTCGGGIVAATGVFTFTPAGPTPPVSMCNISIMVCDGAPEELCGFQTFTIDLVGSNVAPVFTGSFNVSVPENQIVAMTVTSFDPDGGPPTYSLIGGSDLFAFTIGSSNGVLAFVSPPDFEIPGDQNGNNVYEITVQVSDGAGGSAFQAFGVTVTNANEPPQITSSAFFNRPENQTAVTTVTSTDADGGAPSYSLLASPDRMLFAIVPATGVLTFVVAPNFEAPTDVGADNFYEVTVQVSDGNGGTDMQAIQVTVTNVNEAPVFTSAANVSVPENQTSVLTVTTTDQDGGVPSYSLVNGADAGKFSIGASSGVLVFLVAPNFEAPTDIGGDNVYNMTVQANDGSGGISTQAIAVTVTDVSEGGGPTNLSTGETYTEDMTLNLVDIVIGGAASATATLTLSNTTAGSLTTATSGAVTSTYNAGTGVWSASGAVANVNTLLAGVSYVPAANFNANFSIATQVNNGSVFNGSKSMTGTPVNDAPTSTAPTNRSGAEDNPMTFTAGKALSAADVDGTNLTITLAVTNGTLTLGTITGLAFTVGDGNADQTMSFNGAQASLNAALGSLSFAPTPDYNGSASLTYTTSDGVAAAVVKTIALTLTPVVDIVNDSVTTLEDTVASFNVITGTGGASADNFEGTPTVTGVTQGANGGVSSMGNGALMYSPAANFSGSDGFTYTVTAGGVTEVGTVSVSVTAVNDAPTLNAIPDPMPIPVNSGPRMVNLAGIGAGTGDPAQTLTVTAVSNNVALIPNPTVTYTSPGATGSLAYTPVAGQQGSAFITVTVTDNGGTANGGVNTISRTFTQVVANGTIFQNGFE